VCAVWPVTEVLELPELPEPDEPLESCGGALPLDVAPPLPEVVPEADCPWSDPENVLPVLVAITDEVEVW
jgi:hypothetical protein